MSRAIRNAIAITLDGLDTERLTLLTTEGKRTSSAATTTTSSLGKEEGEAEEYSEEERWLAQVGTLVSSTPFTIHN